MYQLYRNGYAVARIFIGICFLSSFTRFRHDSYPYCSLESRKAFESLKWGMYDVFSCALYSEVYVVHLSLFQFRIGQYTFV